MVSDAEPIASPAVSNAAFILAAVYGFVLWRRRQRLDRIEPILERLGLEFVRSHANFVLVKVGNGKQIFADLEAAVASALDDDGSTDDPPEVTSGEGGSEDGGQINNTYDGEGGVSVGHAVILPYRRTPYGRVSRIL